MSKAIINLLCCFIPVRSWRRKLRKSLNNIWKSPDFKKYKSIYSSFGAKLQINKSENQIISEYKNIKTASPITNELEGLLIFTEIFLDEVYQFYTHNEPYYMIDIGLNVGATSIYMANKPNFKKTYGFEPFAETFSNAEKNLELNPELKSKIEIFNFGLSDQNKTNEVKYNSELPGCMSSEKSRMTLETNKTEKIKVKKASEVLAPIFEKHQEKCFLKIDCEGAEFEILPDLDKAGLLEKVDVIIMEWHDRTPESLLEILTKNNFVCFVKNDKTEFGYIKAVRH